MDKNSIAIEGNKRTIKQFIGYVLIYLVILFFALEVFSFSEEIKVIIDYVLTFTWGYIFGRALVHFIHFGTIWTILHNRDKTNIPMIFMQGFVDMVYRNIHQVFQEFCLFFLQIFIIFLLAPKSIGVLMILFKAATIILGHISYMTLEITQNKE